MLLEAQDVSKAFGSFRAVAGADLTIDEGEIIGLIGPNGAGKSTFFNCLAGRHAADQRPDCLRRPGCDPRHRRKRTRVLGIGRTFQVPATFEDMTVLDNVMVGAFLRHPHRGDARDHARQVLELTGLKRASRSSARARSARPAASGSRSRACSRPTPRLMLLDEALAGLTPTELQRGDRAGAQDP